MIGADAIVLEMGQLVLRLGSRVTFLEALPGIAPFEEPEISGVRSRVLRDEGAEIHAGVTVTRIEADGNARAVVFARDGGEHRVVAARILVATGRRPNSQGLGLGAAGVELTERGAIAVDDTLATTNPRVWAKQLASAVGEGAAVALQIRAYLDAIGAPIRG